MFKTTRQLKNFITWCKENGVTEAKIGDISFKVQPEVKEIPLDQLFKPQYSADLTEQPKSLDQMLSSGLSFSDEYQTQEEYERDLYFSSGK